VTLRTHLAEEGPPLGERKARGIVLAGTLDPKLFTRFVNKGLDEAFCQLEVGAQGDVAVSLIRMIRKSLPIWQRSPQNEETRRAKSSGETPLPSVIARKSSRNSPGRRLGSACSPPQHRPPPAATDPPPARPPARRSPTSAQRGARRPPGSRRQDPRRVGGHGAATRRRRGVGVAAVWSVRCIISGP